MVFKKQKKQPPPKKPISLSYVWDRVITEQTGYSINARNIHFAAYFSTSDENWTHIILYRNIFIWSEMLVFADGKGNRCKDLNK